LQQSKDVELHVLDT